MNGYEVMFFGAFFIGMAGVAVEYLNKKGHLLGGKRYSTTPRFIRTWYPVKYIPSEQPVIVKVIDSGKGELVSYLNTVRDTPFQRYDRMSYDQVLATVTPEEADKIKELKEFLL